MLDRGLLGSGDGAQKCVCGFGVGEYGFVILSVLVVGLAGDTMRAYIWRKENIVHLQHRAFLAYI